jgi:pimeloyl-ACP methyl ester carboxylesterase
MTDHDRGRREFTGPSEVIPASPPRVRRRRSWRRRLVDWGFCYVGVMVVLMLLEGRLIYHPETAVESWVSPPDPAITDVFFDLPTGERIHGWWLPRAGSERVVLYCHGNAGNLSHRGGVLHRWADVVDGSVLIFDYPGFGRSTGRPTEQSCCASGEAAWNWLTVEKQTPPHKIVLMGTSLGGGVATELARAHDCRALVLVKTFTSVPDMAQATVPWLPARYLVRHRFDNLSKLPQIHRPVFITHGTADSVIPFSHGERLFAAANEPKQFVPIQGEDHNEDVSTEMASRLQRFLAAHAGD